MTPTDNLDEIRAATRARNRADSLLPVPVPPPPAAKPKRGLPRFAWQGKPWEAFKTIALLFSFIVILILVLVLTVALYWLFDLKNAMASPLVGGL